MRTSSAWHGATHVRRYDRLQPGSTAGNACDPVACYSAPFDQVSRSPTVRLKTGRPGVESGSTTK